MKNKLILTLMFILNVTKTYAMEDFLACFMQEEPSFECKIDFDKEDDCMCARDMVLFINRYNSVKPSFFNFCNSEKKDLVADFVQYKYKECRKRISPYCKIGSSKLFMPEGDYRKICNGATISEIPFQLVMISYITKTVQLCEPVYQQ